MKSLAMLLTVLLALTAWPALAGQDYQDARRRMVFQQIQDRGITDPAVLKAMLSVPRHEFVPDRWRGQAYADHPLPIGDGQTISQPYIVAFMSEALRLKPGQKVLEIGTGSGYQAAVLAAMGMRVYSVEIIPALAKRAQDTLQRLGYQVQVKVGDGNLGWPDQAPFEAIIVTAGAKRIPPELVKQLKPGGRMIIPVAAGGFGEELTLVHKAKGGKVSSQGLLPVRFVPLVGSGQTSR